MSEPDDIPKRVTRLEHEVAEARRDAAAARILAGGADRDVSEMRTELRAHTKSLEALRKTQVEQGDEMRKGFARVDTRIDKLDTKVSNGFTELALGQAQITAILNIAINKSGEA